MSEKKRTFTDVDPATLTEPTPLAIGLFGYTSTGKTESALRLAFGMRRVYGGEVYFADTDNGRGQQYKSMFPFRYIDFPAPHNALDYADLIEAYAEKRGVLVIDQMTEEHDGEDGLLDTQARVKGGNEKKNAVAWGVAKGQHKRLVRVFRRVMRNLPIIVTWRAQDKLDWSHRNEEGKIEPVGLGQMPIGSKDLPFEMTATYLLPPGSRGVPCLAPKSYGEVIMTKIPRFLETMIPEGERFGEAHGEAMARWAVGDDKPEAYRRFAAELAAATTEADIRRIGVEVAALVRARDITRAEADRLGAIAAERRAALAAAAEPAATGG